VDAGEAAVGGGIEAREPALVGGGGFRVHGSERNGSAIPLREGKRDAGGA
jgi:hypothetical protein